MPEILMKAKIMFPMLMYGMQLLWIPVTLYTTLITFATVLINSHSTYGRKKFLMRLCNCKRRFTVSYYSSLFYPWWKLLLSSISSNVHPCPRYCNAPNTSRDIGEDGFTEQFVVPFFHLRKFSDSSKWWSNSLNYL